MPETYRGSCLCAAIRFEVDEFEQHTVNCHCSMCRKFHGAAYATIASVKRNHFHWISGQELIKGYTAENGTTRSFCTNCGSSLMFSSPKADPDLLEIALGCFDDDVPERPNAHIFVASGAKWAVPENDLPQFEAGRLSNRIK